MSWASTQAGVRWLTGSKTLGHQLTREQLDEVYHRFTELADRKKSIYDQDILGLLKPESSCSRNDLAAAAKQQLRKSSKT